MLQAFHIVPDRIKPRLHMKRRNQEIAFLTTPAVVSNNGLLPAPWLAPFSLLFNNLFCRIWLADRWHIVMSRKRTCILSYQFPYFDGRIGQAQRRVVLDCAGFKPPQETASSVRQNLRSIRRSASISLLNPWQISTMLIHRWVLSYPDAFGVGKTRASPVDKRTTGIPSRRSAAGWDSEWESTEEIFGSTVDIWTAFVSEKNINFVHLPLFAKCKTVFTEMVALWTR